MVREKQPVVVSPRRYAEEEARAEVREKDPYRGLPRINADLRSSSSGIDANNPGLRRDAQKNPSHSGSSAFYAAQARTSEDDDLAPARKTPPQDSAIHFDDLDAEEEEQFLRTQKRVAVRRSPLPKKAATRVKKGMVIACVVTAFGLLTWCTYSYGIGSSRFRLESSDNIEITGMQNVSRAQVLEVVGADIERNIFFVPLDERKKQLEEIPWVESATVMRLLPNRLAISLQERTPVAFVKMGPKINLIDANGVVMTLPAGKAVKYSFPIIQGMTNDEPLSSRAATMKIYNRLAHELDSDTKTPSPHMQDISEVDLSDPGDVKVTANNANGTVVVHLGNADFLARYQMYLAHIAEWKQQYPNMHSINLGIEGQIVVNQDGK